MSERRGTVPACWWSPRTHRSTRATCGGWRRARFNDTAPRTRAILPPDTASPLFEAALEATEEAVYNALFQATTVRSANGTAEAIPIDRVRDLLKR